MLQAWRRTRGSVPRRRDRSRLIRRTAPESPAHPAGRVVLKSLSLFRFSAAQPCSSLWQGPSVRAALSEAAQSQAPRRDSLSQSDSLSARHLAVAPRLSPGFQSSLLVSFSFSSHNPCLIFDMASPRHAPAVSWQDQPQALLMLKLKQVVCLAVVSYRLVS
eukprot:764691-Hanusia_phi.AAC.3